MLLHRTEIRIRDPFIYTDYENGCYYMYGTTALCEHSLAAKNTFSVYKSHDLEYFEEPKIIFDGSQINFWADRDFWAPELHKYRDKYYLFASVNAENRNRATQIFVCDTPDGTFVPLSETAITPEEWLCLDGTFFLEDEQPYMVFSHEWVQVKDGEICAIPLSQDLTRPVGEARVLFRASDEPMVCELAQGSGNYVTDGPFLYREDGKIKMMWSSFCEGRYAILEAESDSLFGKWEHRGRKYTFDGGHAMLFETLTGKRMIALHSPNMPDKERACFLEI